MLFDLGNVIFYFSFANAFKRLKETCGLSLRTVEGYFTDSGLEVLYDGGKISSRRFFREVKEALRLSLSYGDFKDIWNGIFTPNQPMLGLIRRISSHHRLVLLSNINAMHFRHLTETYRPLMRRFDGFVLSFKEGVRKPDERIYRAAASACSARPDQIFYIDDRPEMTEMARGLGFQTFTYRRNHPALLRTMRGLGVL